MDKKVEYSSYPNVIESFTVFVNEDVNIEFIPTFKTVVENGTTSINHYVEVVYSDIKDPYAKILEIDSVNLKELITALQDINKQVNQENAKLTNNSNTKCCK